MRLRSISEDVQLYASSTLLCQNDEAPPLVIARPTDVHEHTTTRSYNAYSSIHFRETLPSIMYKILGSKLTLVSLDSGHEATVFECGSPIKNVGIHDDGQNLIVYIFLSTYVLYAMILTPETLENPRMKKGDGWITEYIPPSFQIRRPLYMYSISATSVIFSLADGGLLRLSQNAKGYNEHIFSDSSYFTSFKSILPWTGRPSNLIISMRHCRLKNQLLTLSVDAKLKVWDVSKGQLLSVHDTFATEKPLTFLLPPEPSSFLAINEQAASVTVVTYCPQQTGFFKLFRGRSGSIEEIYQLPEEQPSQGLWRVFDVTIQEVRSDGSVLFHVMWKLDTLSMLQTCHIRGSQGAATWQFAIPTTSPTIPSTSSDAIEQFIFTPGRFSDRVIIEAFSTGPDNLRHHRNRSMDRTELRKLANHAMQDSVKLEVDPETGNTMTEKRTDDLRLRYFNVAQLLVELDRVEGEPHSISKCPFTEQIIVSRTSKISFLRRATELERLVHLEKSLEDSSNASLRVLQAASVLKDGLNSNSWYLVDAIFCRESLAERTLSADDAMFLTHERTLENQVPNTTVVKLQQLQLSPETVLEGLNDLLPVISHVSMRRRMQRLLGIDFYVAEQRDIIVLARMYALHVLCYLIFSACSWQDANLYKASTLYVRYLQTFRQLLLVEDTMTKYLVPGLLGVDSELLDVSRVTLVDDHQGAQGRRVENTDDVIIRGLALEYEGDIPTRDFLDRVLVHLINHSQAKLAVHFGGYITYTPVSSYLKARGLLLDNQYTIAANLFARIAYPLVQNAPSKAETKLTTKLLRGDLMEYHLHVAALFASAGQHQISLRFCQDASLAAASVGVSKDRSQNIQQRAFNAALSAAEWTQAYSIMADASPALQLENIRQFTTAICDSSNAALLSVLPFFGILEEVDSALERKARNMLDVRAKPSYHKILYAHRVKRSDYRGAASILYHRLQFLNNRSHVNGFNVADHLEITEGYLCIINALRCLPVEDAWFIAGTIEYAPTSKRAKMSSEESEPTVRRHVLRLADVKKAYDKVLHGLLVCLKELA